MSRVIKFRAYDSILGEMIPMATDRHLYDLGNSNGWSVMQYTGLKDKNGVDIWEGDVIHHKNGLCNGEVWFWEGAFIAGTATANSALVNYNAPKMIEVIGNIHESPELLEE